MALVALLTATTLGGCIVGRPYRGYGDRGYHSDDNRPHDNRPHDNRGGNDQYRNRHQNDDQ